jgi:HPt (histidine-containing phosphotransfer) domain-containing protein
MDNNSQTIDFTSLNNIANNDEDFIKELIGIFLEQIPAFVNNLNQLFDQNNLEKLGREAHTAKSSVMIFGMTKTGKLLNQIELWAESNNNNHNIGLSLKIVEKDLRQAEIELSTALETGKFL